jgi:hypothetical protein
MLGQSVLGVAWVVAWVVPWVVVALCIVLRRRSQGPVYQYLGVPKDVIDARDLKCRPLRKTVWLLWFQGWDRAPWLVQKVRQSWELLNPGWDIRLLSDANLDEYMPPHVMAILRRNDETMCAAARSDLVRLNLLANQGGVWADATMLCMVPLDEWVHDHVHPAGFWMYHGRDKGAGPASWFMVSKRGSYIACTWRDEAIAYCASRDVAHDYFWMDELFKVLHDNDARFRAEWAVVPYVWCEDPGQAHMLAGKVMGNDADLQRVLYENPPYAVKLSHHGFPNDKRGAKGTNGYHAIQAALGDLTTI